LTFVELNDKFLITEETGVIIMVMIVLALAGILIDVLFIRAEYACEMKKATVLKGTASLMFVLLGVYCFVKMPSDIGKLIVIGLVLGMIGDIFLNMRNLFEGKKSNMIFAVGIASFLAGHFFYIAAIFKHADGVLLLDAGLTVVISVLAIPPLIKRVKAPSMGLKIFGIVYLVIVTAMFSSAVSVLCLSAFTAEKLVFTIGAFLFLVSDFIMIYYSFVEKIKPLRAINLLSYYVGQLLIAYCIYIL